MAFGRSASPTSPGTSDHSGLLSTHAITHSASEPPKPASALHRDSAAEEAAAAPPSRSDTNNLPVSSSLQDSTSPPAVTKTEHEAFSTLHPKGSRQQRENVAYTAAATARGRSIDHHGDFEAEFDPNRRKSIPSPATVIKNLPDAASKTLNTTVAAPARTLDSIKAKLQSPSTGQKSKSDIPDSLDQVEHDLRHNRDAPGNLASPGSLTSPTSPGSDVKPAKSGSFSSLLGRKSQRSKPGSALMQRGPKRSISGSRPERSSSAAQRKSSTLFHDDVGTREEEEEEEEDDDVVQQRIRDQQKRLEDLDEAQTIGLLRTQQEAGIQPVQSPVSPVSKSSWLVGLPLFGGGAGSSKDDQGETRAEEGSSSRRSSFRRGRNRQRAQTEEDDAATDHEEDSPRTASLPRSSSMKYSSNRHQPPVRSASASRAARSKSRPRTDGHARSGSGVLHPPRRQSLTWTSKLRTKIPIKEFPLQGSGLESEFNQECPLWARQPYKYMYFSYFGLSIGLYHLPRWAVSSILPSHRGRPDWSWKKATMVKLYRHGCKLTFRTRTSLGRDLQKEVPHSKTVRCKFTWVDPVGDADVKGELRRAMLAQKVHPQRTCGFWYGDVAKLGKDKRHPGHRLHRHSGEGSGVSTTEGTPMQEEVDALLCVCECVCRESRESRHFFRIERGEEKQTTRVREHVFGAAR